MRKVSVLVVLWVVTMFAAGVWAYAQGQSDAPKIISGNDLGFRVETQKGNAVVGRFVVRVNGQWLNVEESIITKRLTAR